ncbi:MAG: sigma E protease regulator RseP [Ketobacteraceae bacterium]|nr:sigma E protease regulator RseP [Ketobacteraceae bacterium]
MLDFLQIVASFIVTLGVLISVHEYGHFWVARRCGVKVLRFSIGFGKPLVRWKDKQNTEFVIAGIPFGGYVKMLGEPGSDVSEADKAVSFAHKPVYQRIAIVAAGPLVNLAFAILLYWLIFMVGVTRVAPVVGDVEPGSLAASAGIQPGDEIVSVDGRSTRSWDQVNFALVSRLGDDGVIELGVQPEGGNVVTEHAIAVSQWMVDEQKQGPLKALGIEQYFPPMPVIIEEVLPNKAADRYGLQKGDEILSANGQALDHWRDWVEIIRDHPGKPIAIEVARGSERLAMTIIPDVVGDGDEQYGQIGAATLPVKMPENMIREIQYGPVQAVSEALSKTWDFIALTLNAIGKMITGKISLDNLSGPVTIAKVAGDTASYGIEPFLNFMAYLSISLGVLNLLPIPVLDGGHLMYYAAEMIKGSPVSEKVQAVGNSLGLALLVMFMGLAFYNDIVGL